MCTNTTDPKRDRFQNQEPREIANSASLRKDLFNPRLDWDNHVKDLGWERRNGSIPIEGGESLVVRKETD